MESDLHKKLKQKAVEYLLNKSYYISDTEISCGYYGIYDAWGINSKHDTIGIECKVSKADFKNNRFKEARLDWGIEEVKFKNNGVVCDVLVQEAVSAVDIVPANQNYILCPAGLLFPSDIHPKYGLLWFNGERLVNKKKPETIPMTDKKKVGILIGILTKNYYKKIAEL